MTDMSLKAIRERWDVEDRIRHECSLPYFVDDACRALKTAEALREALDELVKIIEKAGLLNLSGGVELGPTVWYVKATERLEYAAHVLRMADGEKQ